MKLHNFNPLTGLQAKHQQILNNKTKQQTTTQKISNNKVSELTSTAPSCGSRTAHCAANHVLLTLPNNNNTNARCKQTGNAKQNIARQALTFTLAQESALHEAENEHLMVKAFRWLQSCCRQNTFPLRRFAVWARSDEAAAEDVDQSVFGKACAWTVRKLCQAARDKRERIKNQETSALLIFNWKVDMDVDMEIQ